MPTPISKTQVETQTAKKVQVKPKEQQKINSTFEKSFKKFLNFENVEPLFSLEEYTGINYKKLYKWKCKNRIIN